MSRLIIGDGKVSKIIRRDGDVIISRDECDITDLHQVMNVVSALKLPVINCAAKTDLEWCEINKAATYDVNTAGVINTLLACEKYSRKFVHISSGCLFDGNDKISDENSSPTPSVWYTKTKAWADEFITSYGYDNYMILRPRQLISAMKYPSNMITKFMN